MSDATLWFHVTSASALVLALLWAEPMATMGVAGWLGRRGLGLGPSRIGGRFLFCALYGLLAYAMVTVDGGSALRWLSLLIAILAIGALLACLARSERQEVMRMLASASSFHPRRAGQLLCWARPAIEPNSLRGAIRWLEHFAGPFELAELRRMVLAEGPLPIAFWKTVRAAPPEEYPALVRYLIREGEPADLERLLTEFGDRERWSKLSVETLRPLLAADREAVRRAAVVAMGAARR